MSNFNERPYIYWKQDPLLNLVKIDDSVRHPNFDPQTNALVAEISSKVIETAKAFMQDLFSRDLVTESQVKGANLTGDRARDMYPDRAVIKVNMATDKQTGQPKFYENGPYQGLPILNFTADIGHQSSHAVLNFNTDGEIKNVKARQVMDRGVPPKWFFTEEEINNAYYIDAGIKKIIEVAREYIAPDMSQSIGQAKNINLPALASDYGLTVYQLESNNVGTEYRCDEFRDLVIYQKPDNSWGWHNLSTDKSGNAIAFLQEYQGMSYKDAVKAICDFDAHQDNMSRNIPDEYIK